MRYLYVFLVVGVVGVFNSQTETPKQPNFADIDGIQITDYDELDEISASYVGTVFMCAYRGGPVTDIFHFEDGKKNGFAQFWYFGLGHEQYKSEGHFKNDVEEGLWTTWQTNGNKGTEGNYNNGLSEGIWKLWHKNGQLKEEVNFTAGKKNGLERAWDKEGQLVREWYYKNGKQVGPFRYFNNGILIRESIHKEGRMISEKEWDENGVLIIQKCWDADGNLIKCD